MNRIQRAPSVLARRLREGVAYLRDHLRPTFTAEPIEGDFARFMPPAAWPEGDDGFDLLISKIQAHRFDILGIGWRLQRYGITCPGLEHQRYTRGPAIKLDWDGNWLNEFINTRNCSYARKLWQQVGKGYLPLDWQLDMRSGYRWRANTWHRYIRYGKVNGVDIKQPWELARLQHLPWLALSYGSKKQQALVDEFKNQVLDFIAQNPPRYGVNWVCTMDVAIRAANILIAYDLFIAHEAEFSDDFKAALKASMYDHGKHIVHHLEWTPGLRANHYLANLAGLVFIAAYLPPSAETNMWLAFATQQLVAELEVQFAPEGSNFEGSTSYHRLSAEMTLYAVALLCALPSERLRNIATVDSKRWPILRPRPEAQTNLYPLPGTDRMCPVPTWVFERLAGMARFTEDLTQPDGNIAQFGDNDSGRFFKLHPILNITTQAKVRKLYASMPPGSGLPADARVPDEQHANHSHLPAAIRAFLGYATDADKTFVDATVLTHLADGLHFEMDAPTVATVGSENEFKRMLTHISTLPTTRRQTLTLDIPADALQGLTTAFYTQFGAYVFKSQRLFLAVRCGPVGQGGKGGHGHNDQLSIIYMLDGKTIIADPGTAVYTPLPGLRNRYRSVTSHFTPHLRGREPASLHESLFRLQDARAECRYAGPLGFAGLHRGYGKPTYRVIQLTNQGIIITDGCDAAALEPLYLPWKPPVPISPGYGQWFAG